MAAGSLLTQITPSDLFRETSVGYNLTNQSAIYQTSSGASRALSFPKFISSQLTEYYNGMWLLPTLVAVGTGLTHKLVFTDDGTSSADLGLVARIGITPFNLSTALTVADWSLAASKGTETFGNVTLGATTGLPVILSIAIVAANLASLASGNLYGIRIRRVGDNAADTCPGRILFLGGEITDT